MTQIKCPFSLPDTIRKLLLSWFFAAAVELLCLPPALRCFSGLQGLQQMSLPRVVGVTVGVFFLLEILARLFHTEKAERIGLAALFSLMAVLSLRASFTWAFLGGCLVVLGIFLVYACRGWNGTPLPKVQSQRPQRGWKWAVLGLAAAFFLFVSAWTVGRVLAFATPSYDFGIFAQMFHSMKTTGLPVTTLERDGLLSHFYVHMSPIYYLMLPFYALFPTPSTLQVLQALVLASAVIPMWKLGERHGLSGPLRVLLCAVLLLYPAYAGGTSYDLHENCFLTPLLLWLLYGMDKKSTPITAVSAVLTLLVKEDAAVYVAVAGLWLVLKTALHPAPNRRRDFVTGGVLLVGALLYFFAVTAFLARIGDGVMTYRYKNLIYDGSASLLTVVKAGILCPMKVLFECVDGEKLEFLALTILPLLGLPLLTRRFEDYLLLIPYVLVNLMSDYRYQHDIFFQYTYGPVAFLLYLTMKNLAQLRRPGLRTAAAVTAAAVSLGCFGAVVAPKALAYPIRYAENREHYQAIRTVLDRIPNGASVTATTFFSTYLSQRETVYDLRYASEDHLFSTDFVVLSLSAETDCEKFAAEGKSGVEGLVSLLEARGYTEFARLDHTLVIYQRPRDVGSSVRQPGHSD